MRSGLIIAASTVYIAVLGCVIFPSASDGKTPAENAGAPFRSVTTGAPITERYRGVVMQLQRVDWIEEYKKSVDEIAALGADTVLFVVDARQENGSSNKIYLDMRMTPTPAQLFELFKHAKSKNLRVILMPIVLLDAPEGDEWRGTIKPKDWQEWFSSYRDVITHFAWVAQGDTTGGVPLADILVIGSELVSTQDKLTEWTRTIDAVRAKYKGYLTYSSNWDNYRQVPFWNQLDLIAMNSYWKLGENKDVSVDQIVANWQGIQKDVLAFTQQQRKPLLFTEVGWCNLENAASEPWNYTRSDLRANPDLQKRLWEGFFRAWHANPGLGGFMIWNWEPGDGGPQDKGYTPEGKPAEKVIREWLAKQWDGK
ncbi:MAG: hypothetical protein ACAI43_15360 [Phycisphaerae bacterium]|nr:hypothetical protein [Tepidisphaeraceae bacterium]